jgi:hypothetical protein
MAVSEIELMERVKNGDAAAFTEIDNKWRPAPTGLLNAESIVPYIEGIISGLPKSERASSELAVANHYASVVRVKDSDAAMAALGMILEGLSEPQRKKTESALRTQYAPAPACDAKPGKKAKKSDVSE